jgi:hypothetical protein
MLLCVSTHEGRPSGMDGAVWYGSEPEGDQAVRRTALRPQQDVAATRSPAAATVGPRMPVQGAFRRKHEDVESTVPRARAGDKLTNHRARL